MERTAQAAPAAVDERRYVYVKYVDEQNERVQRWYYEELESVATDQQTAEREKPKINREPEHINTHYKMLLACLPPDYLSGLLVFFNQRLANVDKNMRPTSKGEVVRFLSLIIVIVLNPGLPVAE
eukprot:6211089-Pleurochrysis_carterae.AAC.7